MSTGASTAPPPVTGGQSTTGTGNRAGASATSGGSPGARPESEKERQAQERMRKATQGICQGC
jgi:hypothetical protein